MDGKKTYSEFRIIVVNVKEWKQLARTVHINIFYNEGAKK